MSIYLYVLALIQVFKNRQQMGALYCLVKCEYNNKLSSSSFSPQEDTGITFLLVEMIEEH